MKKLLKNKNVQIALGVVVGVVVLLVGLSLFVNRGSGVEEEQASETLVQTISPEEIGLTMSITPDGKKVKFKIEKAEGIKGIEYEMTYEADSTAQEQSEGGEDRVQRGITGEAEIEKGESTFESEELDLGSCSKNVCRYDTGVEKVDMTLKITKDDNQVYNVEDSLEVK